MLMGLLLARPTKNNPFQPGGRVLRVLSLIGVPLGVLRLEIGHNYVRCLVYRVRSFRPVWTIGAARVAVPSQVVR